MGTAGVDRIPIVQLLRDEPDLELAGAIIMGPEALAFVERTKPNIAMIDDAGADGPLLPAIRRIIEVSPHTRPVVLSDDCPGGDLRHAIEAGIWGYLNREAPQRTLLWALRAVAGGRVVLYCSLAPEQVGHLTEPEQRQGGTNKPLTKRESAVLAAIADGETDAQIARRPKTRGLVARGDRSLLAA